MSRCPARVGRVLRDRVRRDDRACARAWTQRPEPGVRARRGTHPHGGGGVLASTGTDGIDGPTDAAGAIVDSMTTVRATERGLLAEAALISNGAYDFFAPLGDLIMWGPTGTNIGDLHVVLIHP